MVTVFGFYFNSDNRKVTVCEQVPISKAPKIIERLRKSGGDAEIL